jgi:hypothetical protein
MLLRRWTSSGQSRPTEEHHGGERFQPSRLLDLEPTDLDPNFIRLVETGQFKPTNPYMTLSHCWGKSTVIKLSTETLPSFVGRGLLISQLPRLYRDAIHVVKKLGQRYLWIDSLCIIQDSKEDWLREASRMALVYRNSWCNIAATDAKDGDGTLFFTRNNPAAIRPLEVTLGWHPKGPIQFLLHEKDPEVPLLSRPLNQRGWVLQEQLLAPRTISFGRDQIRWESLDGDASEAFPGGEPSALHGDDLWRNSVPLRPRHVLKKWIAVDAPLVFDFGRSDLHKSGAESFWFSWKQIVEEYTGRFLTFGTDKVVAIAGIASVLGKGPINGKDTRGSSYIAGMWNQRWNIEYELLWEVGSQPDGQPASRPTEYRAPSWSWMSVDGKITYEYKKDYNLAADDHMAFVEDAKVTTLDGSLTGPIVSGHIRIKGPLVEDVTLSTRYDDEHDRLRNPASAGLVMFSLYTGNLIWGLALRQIKSGPQEGFYRRVGTFSQPYGPELHKRLFELPKQLLTII